MVTLHGVAESEEERGEFEATVGGCRGSVTWPAGSAWTESRLRGAVSRRAFRGIWTLETYSAKMEVANGEQEA
jgi:hypothetical protein